VQLDLCALYSRVSSRGKLRLLVLIFDFDKSSDQTLCCGTRVPQQAMRLAMADKPLANPLFN
jgi:hypothetical protein